MTDFKVGQKVWSVIHGWGAVSHVFYEEELFQIRVDFEKDYYYFTADGQYNKNENRGLFFKEIPIPPEALVPPVEHLNLKVGDVVLFNNGILGCVTIDSDENYPRFSYSIKKPMSLDDAYDYSNAPKTEIKKVIGNVHD